LWGIDLASIDGQGTDIVMAVKEIILWWRLKGSFGLMDIESGVFPLSISSGFERG